MSVTSAALARLAASLGTFFGRRARGAAGRARAGFSVDKCSRHQARRRFRAGTALCLREEEIAASNDLLGRSAGRAWTGVALAIGAGIAGSVQIGKVPAAMPLIRADFGLTLAAGAWILSSFNIVGIIIGGVAGALAGSFGTRRAITSGLLLMAAASALGGLTPNFPLLLACRLVEGIGFTLVLASAPTMIAATAGPDRQKLAFGFWSGYMATGQTLMLLISPLALQAVGWRGVWLLNAVFLCIYAAVFWANASAGPLSKRSTAITPPAASGIWRDMRTVLRNRGSLLLALVFTCYTMQYIGLVGFLPTLLIEREGLAPASAVLLTAPIGVANIMGGIAGGTILKLGMRPWRVALIAVLLMAATGCAVFAFVMPLIPIYGLCLTFSAVGGLLPTAVYSAVPVYAPSPTQIGATNGLITQGSNLGQTIGPTLVGGLATLAGWSSSSIVFAAAGIAGALLAIQLSKQPAQAVA